MISVIFDRLNPHLSYGLLFDARGFACFYRVSWIAGAVASTGSGGDAAAFLPWAL
jgi:hypothetical protein